MFFSIDVNVHTGFQGLESFSPQLHANIFRCRVDGLSAFEKKLFRDFRRGTTSRCPLSACLWSVVCRVRSVGLATVLLMSGGSIPASRPTGRLLVFQTACDHSIGFIRCRVQFLCVSGAFPHRAGVESTLQASSIALEQTTLVWWEMLPTLSLFSLRMNPHCSVIST